MPEIAHCGGDYRPQRICSAVVLGKCRWHHSSLRSAVIQLSPHMRIFLFVEPVDFRNGIDGLAGLCRSKLRQDPMNGAVFLFINRRRTALKLLVYDGQGIWLCQKRLSQGRIKHWPNDGGSLTAPQAQVLLYNGDPFGSKVPPPWKALPGTM